MAVGVVLAVPEPEVLELLPQAAKSRTSAPSASKENQKRVACFGTYTSLRIVFSFPNFLLDRYLEIVIHLSLPVHLLIHTGRRYI